MSNQLQSEVNDMLRAVATRAAEAAVSAALEAGASAATDGHRRWYLSLSGKMAVDDFIADAVEEIDTAQIVAQAVATALEAKETKQ